MNAIIDKLEMLVTVSRLLSSKLDIGDLLTTIMRLATRVVNSERASLYLLDEKKQELYFHVALDLDEELKKMRFKLGEGIAGTCAKEGKSIISNNLEKDERHTKKVDEKSGYQTKSLLTCPMIIKGKVIGVVQAINKIDGDFGEEDKDSFEAFASQAAIAIENSRLFNSVKDEKNKLENIFKIIKEGVVVTDEDGTIKMINNAGINYLGYISSKHSNIKDIFMEFDCDMDIGSVIAKRKSMKFLIQKKESQKLILECSFVSDKFESGESSNEFVWIFEDVTQKVMESKISREFMSLVSHKFKTPITSLIGYSQVLEATGKLDKMAKKAVDSIISQSFKLSSLVDEMIDFSTIENKTSSDIKIVEIGIDDFINSVISQMKNKYKEVEFERAVIDSFNINVDIDLFYKAVAEIITNGIKFNSKEKKKIVLTSKIAKGERTLSIWDNGNGIPSHELNNIFERFYQIESGFTGQTEGWGLGLYMVKKILSLHNFSFKIKSQLGKDTIFTIIMENKPVE
ncbi:MAG: GAF domain-containing protein [Elusimicrobiota bacterium]